MTNPELGNEEPQKSERELSLDYVVKAGTSIDAVRHFYGNAFFGLGIGEPEEAIKDFESKLPWLIDGLEGTLQRMDQDLKADPDNKATKESIGQFIKFCKSIDLTDLTFEKVQIYLKQLEAEFSQLFRSEQREPSKIEQTLIAEEGVQVIHPEQNVEIPDGLNLRALEELGITEEEARELVEHITEYLNTPTIIDKFDKDHSARREWRKQIEAKYGDEGLSFLYANKLRVNQFSSFLAFFANVEIRNRGKEPNEKSERIKQLREEYSQIVKGYAEMDIQQKLEAVQRIELWLKEILELFK